MLISISIFMNEMLSLCLLFFCFLFFSFLGYRTVDEVSDWNFYTEGFLTFPCVLFLWSTIGFHAYLRISRENIRNINTNLLVPARLEIDIDRWTLIPFSLCLFPSLRVVIIIKRLYTCSNCYTCHKSFIINFVTSVKILEFSIIA